MAREWTIAQDNRFLVQRDGRDYTRFHSEEAAREFVDRQKAKEAMRGR